MYLIINKMIYKLFSEENMDYSDIKLNVNINKFNEPELPQEKYGYDIKLNDYKA